MKPTDYPPLIHLKGPPASRVVNSKSYYCRHACSYYQVNYIVRYVSRSATSNKVTFHCHKAAITPSKYLQKCSRFL